MSDEEVFARKLNKLITNGARKGKIEDEQKEVGIANAVHITVMLKKIDAIGSVAQVSNTWMTQDIGQGVATTSSKEKARYEKRLP